MPADSRGSAHEASSAAEQAREDAAGATPLQQLALLRARLADCMRADAVRLETRIGRLEKRARRQQPVDRGLGEVARRIGESSARRRRRAKLVPALQFPTELPVSRRREEIEAAVRDHQVVVVCGETGSGKSTQLPKLCLAMGRGVHGSIGHTQPRRLAARSLARRIGEETDPRLVGYKVRFTDETSPTSLVKLMTDGVLLNELRSDPDLDAYDTLIIDEAHERSLNIDFLLGYLKRLLPRRPDLKVIVTSATIDPERFSRHFGGAPVVEVSGRGYPVRVTWLPPDAAGDDDGGGERGDDGDGEGDTDGRALLAALDEVDGDPDGCRGDVLVFLPGERQIREAALLLSRHRPGREVLPLYSRLSAQEQDRVFAGAGSGRIVLATNVAETSLTVPGITAVIDSGLARVSRYSHRAKIQRLPIERVSQASAEQRKGRCGRIAPGLCVRLYSEDDFAGRKQFTEPEIARTNLASVILRMGLLGLGDIEDFPFVDPPERRLVNDGYRLLQILEAVDEERRITDLGRRMAVLPVDPRLARVLLAAAELGALAEILIIASALAIQDPRERPAEKARSADIQHAKFRVEGSDFLAFLKIWEGYQVRLRKDGRKAVRRWCGKRFLSPARMQEWEELHRQLGELMREQGARLNDSPASPRRIHIALLRGFIDLIGQRIDKHEFQGTRGLRFRIFPGSSLHGAAPRWVMASAVIETSRPYAMTVARVRRGWLEEAGAHLLKRSYFDAHWNEVKGRVDAYEQATLFGLMIYTKRRVPYTEHAPDESRAIFIHDALIRDRVASAGEFRSHNRELRTELERLENKLRSREVVASEGQQFAFFDERLPAGVATNRAFERWRRRVEKESPGLLVMGEGDLRRPGAPEVSPADYPDHLELDGNLLPIHYRFDPADEADGATLTLPVALLPRLTQGMLDRLVPAWVHPFLVQLVRLLPKAERKRLPPAPDAARAVEADVMADLRPLPDAFAAALAARFGVQVDARGWERAMVQAWMQPRAVIVDAEDGGVIGVGRDVAHLQARFEHLAERATSSDDFSRRGLTRFEPDALPEELRLQQGAVEVTAWPAFVDEGRSVALELLADREQARRATRDGLVRLAMLALPQQADLVRRDFTRDRRRILMAQGLGSLERMADDLAFLVFRDALAPALAGPVRERAAFEEAVDAMRSGLMSLAERRQHLIGRVLERYAAIRSRLADAKPAWQEAVADVRDQLEVLLAPGFLRHTPPEWLGEYPRYLEAVHTRLEKLAEAPSRDAEPREIVRDYWLPYLGAAPSSPDALAARPALTLYRWQVEELRVSLFAQPLGTRVPVSPKRLDRQWQRVREEQRGAG